MGLDPRELLIRERLRGISNVIAVLSPKGGVGKTLISVSLALILSQRNLHVGLLDLDITNPTAHIVLGINVAKLSPKEEKGVIPPLIAGIRFMTLAYYSKDEALPLRGLEIVDAIREILAITIWGELNYLIVDTPPGLSDEVLEILRLTKPKVIIVTTSSMLSLKSCERIIKLLKEADIEVLGLIENMSTSTCSDAVELCNHYGIKYLGKIPYVRNLDNYIGKLSEFMKSEFIKYLGEITIKITA